MKKEFLIVIIANFIFCFLLPATAIPLFFKLLDPIEDSSSITLLMILVVCFATMLFVFMSLLPRTLNEKKQDILMFVYLLMSVIMAIFAGSWVLSILIGIILGMIMASLLWWCSRKPPEQI